ncbi:MAG TPA: hypothetical protein VJP45_14310 [Candidatus Limnocylindria bacterium]|nr:hypothetical protein [Candidatus Limnocylindria bacterium]
MIGSRVTMLTVALVATLAGSGGAAATWGDDPASAVGSVEIASDTTMHPVLDLPNGCAGDDWSVEDSID